jgi:tetratricopeptide (TPR) repeat protein
MKNLLILLSLITFTLNAQTTLNFDKRNVQCEDKWIAQQMNEDSTYNFGFIYIDEQAGLTFNYEGKFKIQDNVFLRQQEEMPSFKVRLEPNYVAIAEIPEEKFKELGVVKFPDWLKYYKENENSIERLYRWGFLFNSWDECEKALTYLEQAQKLNTKYPGLEFELAYSFNALKRFDKASIVLESAIKTSPNECYLYKELIYSEVNNTKIDNAIKTYEDGIRVCKEKDIKAEMAINIAEKFFIQKDIANFEKWSEETMRWASSGDQFSTYIEKLRNEIKK